MFRSIYWRQVGMMDSDIKIQIETDLHGSWWKFVPWKPLKVAKAEIRWGITLNNVEQPNSNQFKQKTVFSPQSCDARITALEFLSTSPPETPPNLVLESWQERYIKWILTIHLVQSFANHIRYGSEDINRAHTLVHCLRQVIFDLSGVAWALEPPVD